MLKFGLDGTVTVNSTELIALASAVVHAQEGRSPGAAPEDWMAFDSNVQASQGLLDELGGMAMLPVRRDD